ncbi:hypothetical protein D3C72_66650 [compost metagenome]
MDKRPSISTRQAMAGQQMAWKRLWIETFIESGVSTDEAEHAFEVCYGNQQINVFRDPVDDAKGISGMLRQGYRGVINA